MKSVFADSSFYAALLGPRDEHHARARAALEVGGRQIVVSEYVLVELGSGFKSGPNRRLFAELIPALWGNAGTTIVPASTSIFRKAHELFAARLDKEWSLTDCTSFVVMRQRRITEALTADHHFRQAGFATLLSL